MEEKHLFRNIKMEEFKYETHIEENCMLAMQEESLFRQTSGDLLYSGWEIKC